MESGYDSMNSSTEEVVDQNQPEQEISNDVGTGRSYDCMFCKRGFTTAQALGGHMNIHRKDKAKNKPVASSSINSNNQHEENYSDADPPILIYRQPISSYQLQPPYSVPPVNYRTYFPAVTSGGSPSYAHDLDTGQNPQYYCLNPIFEEHWRMSLSLQFGSSQATDVEKKKKQGGSHEKHELDLELRLGYGHDL